ncbi:hypothetical protein AK830_g720 [Neonectria ditissima]|uniref:Uncharacterized protein n=1 Tax=Neonectria ditissima TaxID=78410 RepID=A0A0N8H8Z8_9HYPO|nr:hypothetical protein AK830_g720 [Neonectria ditissima]
MPLATELTRRLGIRVPVVQGGMMHVGIATLASAVSNAGGLGTITALNFASPTALRSEIRRCRALTANPFAINITLLPSATSPDYRGYAQAAIDEGITIVETAGNSPGPIIAQLKDAGVTVLHKCTSIRHAQSAARLGADFLSIDGFECAGHVGESDITNLILLSKARQVLNVPFIASGGFADGWGLASALCLGASGINMGTRFLCTQEAPVHDNIKREIVQAQETDTVLLLRRWRNTNRLYKNAVAREALELELASETGSFDEVAPLVSGKRGKAVFETGDPEAGPLRFKGNQLAIIRLANTLSTAHMQAIAREFNFSETVFLRAQLPDGSFPINIFTPVNEMAFAGHPVVGAGHALFRNLLPGDLLTSETDTRLTVRTNAGPVAVSYDRDAQIVSAEHPRHAARPRLAAHALLPSYPALSIVKGVTYTLVDLTAHPELFAAVGAAESQATPLDDGWAPSFLGTMYYRVLDSHAEAGRKVQNLRVRMIAINLEDPACGSGSCALGAYLALQGGGKNGQYRFVLDQGSEIGRDSNIIVDVVLDEHGTGVASILLSGHAAPVTEGVLSLPE